MKPITFLGDSLSKLREFPIAVRTEAGHQLNRVQNGLDPDDWKPLKTVGPGVREIRIREEGGAFRVIYLAGLSDRVLVLHAFRKKTQQTPGRDIDLAASRLRDMEGSVMETQTFSSVFDALAESPAEAANMKARSDLLLAIQQRVHSWGVSQEVAAKRLGMTRPRVSDLMTGKLGKFSLDALVNISAGAGLTLEIRVA